MSPRPLAGKPAPPGMLTNIPRLITAYFAERPDPAQRDHRVAFGTSGHRGSSFKRTFNEAHIVAITEAICLHRREHGVDGPLFLAMDTHALSEPAFVTALEVLAANGVEVMIDSAGGYTPTPAVSHAILTHNRGRKSSLADGIVITPSHNPPEDGGIKYNPPHGGPADTKVTKWVEERANAMLPDAIRGVARVPYEKAMRSSTTHRFDYTSAYVNDLASVLDMEAIRSAKLKIGVDPLGGAGVSYWKVVRERYGLDIEVVNEEVDPTFRFMTLDWDEKIRMDCSSQYAMAGLIALRDRFDVAFGNDTDYDRHGIVTRGSGLLSPNHYLSAIVSYLFKNRPGWRADAAVGKTIVTTLMLDRIAGRLGRKLVEVPVGFKWFVPGLLDGSFGFGGEESAGASFVRMNGTAWTTDKDGIILGLGAAEMMARTDKDPGEIYKELVRDFGEPAYERIDEPATAAQKDALVKLAPEQLPATQLAGEPIIDKLVKAPGNKEAIGGLKVVTKESWFAARPSGTEDVYKIYAETFRGPDHLRKIQDEAKALIAKVFASVS